MESRKTLITLVAATALGVFLYMKLTYGFSNWFYELGYDLLILILGVFAPLVCNQKMKQVIISVQKKENNFKHKF